MDLVRIEGNNLVVKGLDALDKSPLLDIKPYVYDLDAIKGQEEKSFQRSSLG